MEEIIEIRPWAIAEVNEKKIAALLFDLFRSNSTLPGVDPHFTQKELAALISNGKAMPIVMGQNRTLIGVVIVIELDRINDYVSFSIIFNKTLTQETITSAIEELKRYGFEKLRLTKIDFVIANGKNDKNEMIIQALEKNQFVEAERSQKRYKIPKGFEDEMRFSVGADGREITAATNTAPQDIETIINGLEKRISLLERQLKSSETEKSELQKKLEETLLISQQKSKLNKDDNDILEILSQYPDGIMMQDLIKELAAKQSGIKQGTIRYKASVSTDRLKELGLIKKERKGKEVKVSPAMEYVYQIPQSSKKEKSEDSLESETVSPERIAELVKTAVEFLNSKPDNLTRGITLQEIEQQIGIKPEEEKPFLEAIEEKCHIIGNPVEPENCYIRLKLKSQQNKDKEPEEIKIETDQPSIKTERPFWEELTLEEPLKEKLLRNAVPTAVSLIKTAGKEGINFSTLTSKTGLKKSNSAEFITAIRNLLTKVRPGETLEIIHPEDFEKCVLKIAK